jgi:hypothetical protein
MKSNSKASLDNRSRQLNPVDPTFQSSRGFASNPVKFVHAEPKQTKPEGRPEPQNPNKG